MPVGYQPDLFVFIGLPGCGKSTLGKMLAEKLRLNFYEMSSLIDEAMERARLKSEHFLGAKDEETERQRRLKESGFNCENVFVCKLAAEKLLGYSYGTILCGFPRDEEQAENFINFAKQTHSTSRILAIFPKVTDGVSIDRLSKKLGVKEREMNIPELVQLRLENIKKDCNRVLSILGRSHISVLTLNGMQEPQKVFEDMFKVIIRS